MNTVRKPTWLTYLGALPFLYALAVAAYGFFDLNAVLGTELRFARFKSYMVAHTYGAVIVAFLAGIQWGVSLNQPTDQQYFIISNVLALMAWFSLFAFASLMGMLLITVAFLLALWVDRHAHQQGMIPTWFWRLRLRITVLVVTTLVGLMLLNQ
ncbi:DUF3429 domain-containing protein [Marinicella meishanensis]|uniref:DUF3429 domain-containing protein n=1 Tax=Marinicella meishanensis TaxID=2873263 RepID=UPI001CBC191E|nr:DUF3429 domain-containing protein [Marinicella sp. NBU2979]